MSISDKLENSTYQPLPHKEHKSHEHILNTSYRDGDDGGHDDVYDDVSFDYFGDVENSRTDGMMKNDFQDVIEVEFVLVIAGFGHLGRDPNRYSHLLPKQPHDRMMMKC